MIDAIEKQLELHPEHVGPSRETLFRYGNVSSASIWCARACVCVCVLLAASVFIEALVPAGGPGWTAAACASAWAMSLARPICCHLMALPRPRPHTRPLSSCSPPHRYVLSNIETKRGVRRGERIWQIAFGSGEWLHGGITSVKRP